MSATLNDALGLAAVVALKVVNSIMPRPLIEELCDDYGVDTVVSFLVHCERFHDWDCATQIEWANKRRPNNFSAQVTKVLEDLKYLGRLDYNTFKSVLFPHATEDYLDEKWLLWNKDRLGFLYSCSSDKILLLCDYIEICKHGGCDQ